MGRQPLAHQAYFGHNPLQVGTGTLRVLPEGKQMNHQAIKTLSKGIMKSIVRRSAPRLPGAVAPWWFTSASEDTYPVFLDSSPS